MLVFTEIWLQELVNRYRNHKRHTKPFVYFVATEDEFQATREQVEEWVAILPEHLQKKAIANLRAEANFQQTYHELVVGSLFRNLGLLTEYEKAFNGQTPDWFVSSSDGSQHFVVEVVTENISQSVASWDARISNLQGRLSELQFDFALGVHVPFDLNVASLDSRHCKSITERVKQWLANDNPSIGNEKEIDGFSFEVAFRDRGYSHVLLIGFARPFSVNPQPLKENIEEKVRKYQALATSNKIPFMVAVVMEFRTGYDAEELENVLFGQEVVDVAFDKTTNQIINQATRRRNDGLFKDRPLLSGVILARRPNMGKWEIKSYLNPNAQHPLPADIFV